MRPFLQAVLSHTNQFLKEIFCDLQVLLPSCRSHNKVLLERVSRAAELLFKLSRRRISNEGREKELLSVLLKANPLREDVLS